jgi:hypothetical protein
MFLLPVLHVFYLVMESSCKESLFPHSMRTRPGATEDTPSSSRGRQPTPPFNPPPAPTLADAITNLINRPAS